MNRRAEALNPAAEQTLRAPKYEASSIFTLVAQSERYLYPIYLSLISFRRIKQAPESAVKDTLSGVYKNGRFFSVRPVQVLSSDPPATLHGYHEHCESLSRA